MSSGSRRLRDTYPDAVIVEVPLTLKKRGGRKQVMLPGGSCTGPLAVGHMAADLGDAPLVKALARAHRWKEMLESGSYGSMTELADHEKVNRSYLCRVLRLTLLAPEIVQAVLDGRSAGLSLDQLMRPFTAEWTQQARRFS